MKKTIETQFFLSQLHYLSRSYPLAKDDYESSKKDFLEGLYDADLGQNFYKIRIKNSSVPTGKRGGFRLVVNMFKDTVIPILIYSKSQKDNISFEELLGAFEKIVKELSL